MAKKKYRIEARSTTNTYTWCQTAAREALRQAERPDGDCFCLSMMAVVFAAFMVEGFLNHMAMEKNIKGWDIIERKMSPRDKMQYLQQVLGLSIDMGKPPFQSFSQMQAVSDALAHAKTVETETIEEHAISINDEWAVEEYWPMPRWMQTCRSASAVRCMVDDAEAIVRSLSEQAGFKWPPFGAFGIASFEASEIDPRPPKV